MVTFEENSPKFEPILIRKGMAESLFVEETNLQKLIQESNQNN
jgi:hypothetical protein